MNFLRQELSLRDRGAVTGHILLVDSLLGHIARSGRRPRAGGVTDNLGSVVAVIDTAGNIAAQYSYDPYGSTVSASEG